MKRWLYAHTTVDGDPAALDRLLREHVHTLLRRATGTPEQTPAPDGSFVVRLGTDVVGLKAAKDVRVRTDVAEVVAGRTRIGLSWVADPAKHAFPAFDGAVELERLSPRHAQLALVGSYRVPLGPVGAAIDDVALHPLAVRTFNALVERLGRELEALADEGAVEEASVELEPPIALRVRDVMTPDPMVFDERLSLRTAAMLLVYRGVQGAPVVAPSGKLLGVLSEQDLLEKEAAFRPAFGRGAKDVERRREAVTAGEACTRPARATVPDATLREAARMMLDHRVARLVVVDGSAIAGIVTRHDVLKALLRADAELEAAVRTVLETLDEPDVRVRVVWGEVFLDGAVSVRTMASTVLRLVSEVDGIVAVHDDLTWHEDDVVAAVYGLHQ